MSASPSYQGLLQDFAALAKAQHLLPVQVTPHYQRLVDEELARLGTTDGPLFKIVYPTRERMRVRAPGEVRDFVEDRDNMPSSLRGIAVRKYVNRMLFFLTERCAAHCMYCFRQDVLSEENESPIHDEDGELRRLGNFLEDNPQVEEVILSGGDPLSAPATSLARTLEMLSSVSSVRSIRVHTRNVIYAPRSVTQARCELLGEFNVRLVIHTVHPYELVDDTVESIARLQAAGVRCYAQFPVLRGVNDHPRVLERHLTALDCLGVRPLTLFVPDPINYSAAFRLQLERLFGIYDQLYFNNSAWISAVRLVLDTPVGKVRRDDIVNWDRKRNVITFARDGKHIEYEDFPAELDIPGRLDWLLWKDG
jgi:KamA family protein